MELKSVRVKKRELTCRTCETEFFGYSAIPAEEGGAQLFECEECHAIFSLSAGASLQAGISGKHCPDCDCSLEETLVEKTQAGSCPMCEDRDYYGSGAGEVIDFETYSLG